MCNPLLRGGRGCVIRVGGTEEQYEGERMMEKRESGTETDNHKGCPYNGYLTK